MHSLTAHLFTITHFCISEFSRKPKLNPQSFYFNHCNGKVSNFPHFLKDEDSKWSPDNCEKEIQLPCEHELEYNAPFKWYFCLKFNDMENAHSIMLNGKRRCTAIILYYSNRDLWMEWVQEIVDIWSIFFPSDLHVECTGKYEMPQTGSMFLFGWRIKMDSKHFFLSFSVFQIFYNEQIFYHQVFFKGYLRFLKIVW